jgi:hypothetical protein
VALRYFVSWQRTVSERVVDIVALKGESCNVAMDVPEAAAVRFVDNLN